MLANNSQKVNGFFTSATVAELIEKVNAAPARSAWTRGVKMYAVELLEGYADGANPETVYLNAESPCGVHRELLNGAPDWGRYSWGGCSEVYDPDIAKRLCTPSELKKTRNGERRPNASEEWLDTQARALYQAAVMIARTLFNA